MRRILIIAAATLGIGSAAWGGLWVVARGEVETLLDREFARLRAEGAEITFSERIVSGFPGALSVEHRDVVFVAPDGRLRFEAEWTRTRAAALDAGLILTTFAPEMQLRLATPDGPVDVAIAQEALTLAVPAQERGRVARLTAMTLEVAATGEAVGRLGDLSFADLAVDGRQGIDGTLAVDVKNGSWSARWPTPEGPAALRAEGLSLAATTATPLVPDAAALAARPELSILRFDVPSVALALGETGAIRHQRAERLEGRVVLGGGMIEGRGVYTGLEGRFGALALPTGPVTFDGRAERFVVETSVPFGAGVEAAPFAVEIELEGLTGDPALWDGLDPGERLSRDPAAVSLSVAGLGRALAAPPPGGLPFEATEISALDLDLAGLGAALAFDGSGRIAPPMEGAGTLRLEGAEGLIDGLAAAGLIQPAQLILPRAFLLGYTRAEGDGDVRVVDLAFTNGVLTANGVPVTGP